MRLRDELVKSKIFMRIKLRIDRMHYYQHILRIFPLRRMKKKKKNKINALNFPYDVCFTNLPPRVTIFFLIRPRPNLDESIDAEY